MLVRISLSWWLFMLAVAEDCKDDWIEIIDTENMSAPLIRACGTKVRVINTVCIPIFLQLQVPKPLRSRSKELQVRLHTSGTWSDNRRGFRLRWNYGRRT